MMMLATLKASIRYKVFLEVFLRPEQLTDIANRKILVDMETAK